MKTTGAVWKAYLDSWPDGQWFDDSDETYDGKTPTEADAEPSAIVEFSVGVVLDENNKEVGDLVRHFRKWLRAQTHTTMLCQVPIARLEEFKAAAVSVGAKVLA